jgi:hypothetical protein
MTPVDQSLHHTQCASARPNRGLHQTRWHHGRALAGEAQRSADLDGPGGNVMAGWLLLTLLGSTIEGDAADEAAMARRRGPRS